MSKGLRVGIESKIESTPAFDVLGDSYESMRRTGVNEMQAGATENEVEKTFQSRFNIQWAWADSIATEATQAYKQLKTARQLDIVRIAEQVKKKTKKAKTMLSSLRKVKFPTQKHWNKALGLKSKIKKIGALSKELARLRSEERFHVCFGSKKLFNAQHHLEENGYSSHQEWREDWKKARGGRFYCVGKGQHGGGTMIKIFHVGGDEFKAVVTLPRFMQAEYGKTIEIPFTVEEDRRQRKSNLLYALGTQKPVTVQIFRREHKSDQWYIHLTTYVQDIPIYTSKENGCLGLDFNKESVEWAYILPDGNIQQKGVIPFNWKGLSSGQRSAMMRDLVAEVVRIAEAYQCPISIESLDFRKKKAAMSEASKAYNAMLSNLSTSMFREALESRCRRQGVKLIKVNPAFTSIVGLIKFMRRYGLNSGTAAAMVIARRALGFSERAPKCLVRPEDLARHSWRTWNRVARFLKSNSVRRHNLFDWKKALGKVLAASEPKIEMSAGDSGETVETPLFVSRQSNRTKGESPMLPTPVQLCIGFQ